MRPLLRLSLPLHVFSRISPRFLESHPALFVAYETSICAIKTFVNITLLFLALFVDFSTFPWYLFLKGGDEMKERLKQLRKTLGITQQEFADKIGIKRNSYANYETGRNTPIDAIILSICREFDVNEDWLRTGEGEMFKERSPSEEIGYYVEDLLEYDGHGNPFYDMIVEMMKTYVDLDEKSQAVIRSYFQSVSDGIHKKEEDC